MSKSRRTSKRAYVHSVEVDVLDDGVRFLRGQNVLQVGLHEHAQAVPCKVNAA